jgi:hypothetical protein
METRQFTVFCESTTECNMIASFLSINEAINYVDNQVKGLQLYDGLDNTGSNNHEKWFVTNMNNSSEDNPIGEVIYETDVYYNK